MPTIVLSTINAKYAHASLALRYLFANLGDLQNETHLREFVISERAVDIAEAVLAQSPKIVGFGVYIWNCDITLEVVRIVKKVAPQITIVLGGPEISHETEAQELTRLCDFVICGEADLEFGKLCERVLNGRRPLNKIIRATPPELSELASPYRFYSEHDLQKRVVYVEASRGCPFSCEFCLSSLDEKVRQFPLAKFLAELEDLVARGATHIKFIDRTFNLNPTISTGILDFFLNAGRTDLFAHFEMVPDRFPEALKERIKRFADGAVQVEVGIQTFNDDVAARISRRHNPVKIAENLSFLRDQTGVHIHADLIFGLPGETLESMAQGFDTLAALAPHEIQLGILKRLRGTPIIRHDEEWGMIYADTAPYEILANKTIDFATMQRLKRMARSWDLVANRGNFRDTLPLILAGESVFFAFLQFSDWLAETIGSFGAVALERLSFAIFDYLVKHRGIAAEKVAGCLVGDYCRPGRRPPPFLAAYAPGEFVTAAKKMATPRRQAKHLM